MVVYLIGVGATDFRHRCWRSSWYRQTPFRNSRCSVVILFYLPIAFCRNSCVKVNCNEASIV